MNHLLILIAILVGTALANDLEKIPGCVLVPTDWADGDSFRILAPDGTEHTLRLYGADCIESEVRDTTDARRLRAQRRYFGISGYGGSPEVSIAAAKQLGKAATERRAGLLGQPFTIHTSFADGRGDANFKRIYAFVTTGEGEDLASILVREGLARAYGVYRRTPDGRHANDYREELADLELLAARKARGAWKLTDWDTLPAERRAEREEEAELSAALDGRDEINQGSIDPNTASRDELMRLPGVGEKTANAIIEHRPYRNPDELQRVPGIGPKTLGRILPYLSGAGIHDAPRR